MALRYFEQDFNYDFYPLRADRCTYEVLPVSPVSIYVYDGLPSEEDAAVGASGTGYSLLETVAAWTDTADGQGKRIAVSAIPEPSDYNLGEIRKHYIVINTALTNPIPPIIKEIRLTRMVGQESIIDVSVSDVLGIEPQIELFCNKKGLPVGEVEQYIEAATKEIKLSLTDCEMDFSALTNPGQLNYAVTLLAISKFFRGQSRDVGDIHWSNYLAYKDDYNNALKKIKIELDLDGDGIADAKRSAPSGVISLRIVR